MNRAQRRAEAKATPAWRRNLSAEDIIRGMSKNGITPQQYDEARQKEYERGFSEGVQAGREEAVKMTYAAICLAARGKFGFGQKRVMDLLVAVDDQITNHLHSSDAIDQVFDELDIELSFDDPFSTVRAR